MRLPYPHKKPEYPYKWDRDAKPAGRKGKRCRIIGKTDNRVHNGQGIVRVEFQGGAIFDVQKKGLVKADE